MRRPDIAAMTKYLFIFKPILRIADKGARLRWHKTSSVG